MAFAHRCFPSPVPGRSAAGMEPQSVHYLPAFSLSPKLAALPTGKGAQTQLVTACPKQPLQGAGQKARPPFRDSRENPAASRAVLPVGPCTPFWFLPKPPAVQGRRKPLWLRRAAARTVSILGPAAETKQGRARVALPEQLSPQNEAALPEGCCSRHQA